MGRGNKNGVAFLGLKRVRTAEKTVVQTNASSQKGRQGQGRAIRWVFSLGRSDLKEPGLHDLLVFCPSFMCCLERLAIVSGETHVVRSQRPTLCELILISLKGLANEV